jgi:hypothetical protein
MEHVEGRQFVLAALQAGRRKLQSVLVSHGAHLEKLQDIPKEEEGGDEGGEPLPEPLEEIAPHPDPLP